VSLARAWRRALLGASGVGLLVPLALVAALTVTATIGGPTGLGALEQVFGGPAVPLASRPDAPQTADTRRGDPRDFPVVPRARTAARTAGGGSPADRRSSGSGGRADRSTGGSRRRDPAAGRIETPGRDTVPPTAGQPPGTTPPGPQPPRPRNPVRGLGTALADTIRRLPAVGPPVADAVQTVVDLVAPPEVAKGRAVPAQPSATAAEAAPPAAAPALAPAPAAPAPAAPAPAAPPQP